MKLPLFRTGKGLLSAILTFGLAVSCVKINSELGKEFIPISHQYDVYVEEIELSDIKLKVADSLSGYSSTRFTVGALMDETFGKTRHSAAMTLIPITSESTIDFGENPVVTQFHFTAAKDTVSVKHSNQEQIIQNINVYALTEEIGDDAMYLSSEDKLAADRSKRITKGIPLYTGGDSLSFDFSDEFAKMYLDKLKTMTLDSVSNYVKELPGILITTDDRSVPGGRINLFDLALDVEDSYYITGNYAELKFRTTYPDRGQVDTSVLFFFGAQDFEVNQVSGSSYYATSTRTSQYGLNLSSHQSISDGMIPETATDKIYIEGGGGVKPVFSAREIREKCLEKFTEKGLDPEKVIINKAVLSLPFDFPAEDEAIENYPDQLSPTCRLRGTSSDGVKYVSYAGLSDSSVDTEDPGDINRSTCHYTPDIGHHVQELIRRLDEESTDADYEQYNIWLLIMAEEVVESSSSSSSMNDYYSNLMYYSYLNSLYNGYGYGYGGYGGYGYGSSYYGYSNYINYALAAQYSSSQSTTQTSTQLDRDRYYCGILRGPESAPAEGSVPKIILTYSVAKTAAGE